MRLVSSGPGAEMVAAHLTTQVRKTDDIFYFFLKLKNSEMITFPNIVIWQ